VGPALNNNYGTYYDNRTAYASNYITGGRIFITGSGDDVINVTNEPGATLLITGSPKVLSGENYITGIVSITGGQNIITGSSIFITGGENIRVHGESPGQTIAITGKTVGPVNNTGDISIIAETANISEGVGYYVSGNIISMSNGAHQVTGNTITLTNPNITNEANGNIYIDEATNVDILSGTTYVTGTDIGITGGTVFMTGVTDDSSFMITGSEIVINNATGTTFEIYSGTIDVTGSDFLISGDFTINSGTFNRIESVAGNLILNEGSIATMINPTFKGHATSYGVLQVNGDVSFLQTSGDTMVSGILTYRYTGFIPASTADSVGTTGDIAFDNDYMYFKTTLDGWKRSSLSTW
jgi:cytoskeletal protein CcmA (bactofilin family)